MNFVIYGSRDLVLHPSEVEELVKTHYPDKLHLGLITQVVCGMARGADLSGKRWADSRGINVVKMPADWRLGRGAGHIRNAAMAAVADFGLGLWDGSSTGTANMAAHMALQGKPNRIVLLTPDD